MSSFDPCLGVGSCRRRLAGLGPLGAACAASALCAPSARATDPGLLVEQVMKLVAPDGAASDQFGAPLSLSGDVALVGSRLDDDAGDSSGGAYVFGRDVGGMNNWGLVKKLVAPDAAMGDSFGFAVSIGGGVALVGAVADDDAGSSSGSAYVFGRNVGGSDNWGFVKKLVAPDGAAFDNFGGAVAVSAGWALIGAFQDDDAGAISGSAYVFGQNIGGLGNWGFQRKLVAPDGAANDFFARAVTIDEATAVVATSNDADAGANSGSAYIFGRDVGGSRNWGFLKKLVAPDGAAEDQFGIAVSVSGDVVALGASLDDDAGSESGSAYLFGRDVGGVDNWGLVKKLVAPDAAGGDRFGVRTSINGCVVVVGASLDDDAGSSSGSAYAFGQDVGAVNNWGFVRKLVAPDAALGDQFGSGVAVSGDVAVIGAETDDDAGANSGSAHVFDGLETAGVLAADCDSSGESDAFELAMGMAADCNDNGRPDSCDIADGTSPDANMNGVPDECDLVCLGDLNGDNAVDTADLGLLLGAFGTMCAP